jgi:thioredoxin
LKTKILTLLFLSMLCISCKGQNTANFASIPPADFAKMIKGVADAQILDVRTSEEFSGYHIENAKNIDWNGEGFDSNVQLLDKSRPVFVYCLAGGRSKKAAAKLHDLGFTEIYELDGGIMKWNAAGLAPKSDKKVGLNAQDYAKLISSDQKILIVFYAEWCEPCKKMAPYLKKMQAEMGDNVKIIRLNADENKTLVSEIKIEELPTLMLYQNKEMKWTHKGLISEVDLNKQLK